jgi:N-glycosylase/DNA lyase
MAKVELELRGAGGEPVHFWRTVNSHGLNDLLPNRIDSQARTLELTVHPGPQTIVVRESRPGIATIAGRAPRAAREVVRHVLRLDEDLSALYRLLAEDPHLAWTTVGAGRMMRSPTVFEDVVKTICTTNCAWSGTVRMTSALVEHLGDKSDRGRRAFPTPEAMAEAPESFYRDVARAGYRGAYLRSLAASVAAGDLDLEELQANRELPDEGRTAAARAARRRPLRRGARDDADRPLLEARARLVDAADVRKAERPQGERRDDDAPLPPLRALRGARVLALPHARLGGGVAHSGSSSMPIASATRLM